MDKICEQPLSELPEHNLLTNTPIEIEHNLNISALLEHHFGARGTSSNLTIQTLSYKWSRLYDLPTIFHMVNR